MKTGERLVTERNRRLLLRRRPVGLPVPEDFELVEEALPIPRDGAILVRNHLCSLDPGIRGWLDDAPSYIPPIALNDAVRAITVGHIVTSLHPDFQTGNCVVGMNARSRTIRSPPQMVFCGPLIPTAFRQSRSTYRCWVRWESLPTSASWTCADQGLAKPCSLTVRLAP